ncbi:MAG: metallophosphoesterase [Bacillota bacterium]
MLKRVAALILFLAIFFAFYGAANYYVFTSLVQALALPAWARLPMGAAVLILALAYPLAQSFRSRLRLGWLLYAGALWMGFLSIAVAVFAVGDLLYLLFFLELKTGAGIVAVLLFLLAFFLARRGPGLKQVRLRSEKLSQPLRIVHLSDLHLGALTSCRQLEGTLARVDGLEADLVVITGDLVEDSFAQVQEFVPLFRAIKVRYGVHAVSGNHEHYQGIEHFHDFCRAAGITVLDGKALQVAPGVNLLGLGGEVTRAGKGFSRRVRGLLSGTKSGDYNIFLLHHPVGFATASKLGVDLQLSGHTHRGQLLPFNLLVPLVYRHYYGIHRRDGAYIYTTSGAGTWGPPLRLGSSSEIVQIDLY